MMLIPFFALALLIGSWSVAEAKEDGYKAVSVKVISTDHLCILERYVGTEEEKPIDKADEKKPIAKKRDIQLCTLDTKEFPNDEAVIDYNAKLETLFKDEAMKEVLDNYASNLPKNSHGARTFIHAEFERFLNKIENDPSCKNAVSTYYKRKAELEQQLRQLEINKESNEKMMIGSCGTTSATSAKPTLPPAPARR